ncbi:hypothetical protein Ddc_11074 [Ditylenchus destructor]|nr:hypothetical protein Ddc_11074 [Ditylenchus destructor]
MPTESRDSDDENNFLINEDNTRVSAETNSQKTPMKSTNSNPKLPRSNNAPSTKSNTESAQKLSPFSKLRQRSRKFVGLLKTLGLVATFIALLGVTVADNEPQNQLLADQNILKSADIPPQTPTDVANLPSSSSYVISDPGPSAQDSPQQTAPHERSVLENPAYDEAHIDTALAHINNGEEAIVTGTGTGTTMTQLDQSQAQILAPHNDDTFVPTNSPPLPQTQFMDDTISSQMSPSSGEMGTNNAPGKRRQYIPPPMAVAAPGFVAGNSPLGGLAFAAPGMPGPPPALNVCPSGGPSLPVECDPKRPWPQCPPQSYCYATNSVDIGPYYCCPIWSTYGAQWRPATPFYNYAPPPPPNWPDAMRMAAQFPAGAVGLPPMRKSKKEPRFADAIDTEIIGDEPTEEQRKIAAVVNDWVSRQEMQNEIAPEAGNTEISPGMEQTKS